MIVGAIWTVDLDNATLNFVFLEVAVYRNQRAPVGVCTRSNRFILSPMSDEFRGALDGFGKSDDQTCEWFCN
jgi:hypothetical protein